MKFGKVLSLKFGFTLAEVLIVVGIIGIVAEMTIPTLVGGVQDKQMVTGLLKFTSTLQQAVIQWKQDQGCTGDAFRCISDQSIPDNDPTAFDQIAKFMKVSQKTTVTGVNWLPADTLNYYGDIEPSISYGKVANTGFGNVAYLLQDGTTFSIDYSPGLFAIYVDVNGPKKPNRNGKDTFAITVGGKAGKDIYYDAYYALASGTSTRGLCIVSLGCDASNINPTAGNGASPAAYIILNSKFPDYKTLAQSVSGFRP